MRICALAGSDAFSKESLPPDADCQASSAHCASSGSVARHPDSGRVQASIQYRRLVAESEAAKSERIARQRNAIQRITRDSYAESATAPLQPPPLSTVPAPATAT